MNAPSRAETPGSLLAQAVKLKQEAKELKKSKGKKLTTFSHIVMGGIMMMYFVGVGLGVFVTIWRGEPVSTTLDYIMKLAYVVSLGYFVKAFGENIAKIVLSGIFGNRMPDTEDTGGG